MQTNQEVRYGFLTPDRIADRREAFPVVYIPLGIIEWHGLHDPTGVDALRAEGIAVRCAQLGGGLVFPALWYGETRAETVVDTNPAFRDQVAGDYRVDPSLLDPAHQPFGPMEQVLQYQRLLIHVLAQAESAGFKVAVLVCGHAPLVDHATAAALLFNKRVYSKNNGLLAWAFVDSQLLEKQFPGAGDHAGGWETSQVLALHPDSVNQTQIPAEIPRSADASGKPWPANAAFGEKIIQAAAEAAVREVKDRVENRRYYLGHGKSMTQGRWRGDTRA